MQTLPPCTALRRAYISPTAIQSRPQDVRTAALSLGPAGPGGGLRLTLSAPDGGGASCSEGLALIDADAGPCPEGTEPRSNPPPASGAMATAARQCVPCDAGFACPMGAADPQGCAAGSFNELVGATACVECPEGAVSRDGADACQACAPGTVPTPSHTQCQLCPGGHFSNAPGGACQRCPAGSFRPEGGGDGTACTLCPPGFYSAEGAVDCEECPAGYFAGREGTPDACEAW